MGGNAQIIVYSKALNYPRYKKAFIEENLKTGFSDTKKLKKTTKIKKKS